jgi:hypothetical protein
MLTPPGRLAPGRWRFRMRPPLRPGASQPTLWPHPSPKPHPRPPRAPPDIPCPLPVPSAVHRPSTVRRHRPRSAPPSAVRRPHSFIRSPFVDGLPSPNSIESPSSAACRPPSIRRPQSAVHRLHSFIRSPFADGLPSARLESRPPPSAVRGLSSTVHIRLFVPHSLTVCPPPNSIESPSSAACRPPFLRHLPSAVHIRLFVPHSLTVCPPPNSIKSPSSALHHPSSTVHVLPRPPPSAVYYPSPSPSSASSGRVPAASQARQYPRLKVWSRDVKAWGAGRAPGRAEASVPRQRPQPPS